MMFTSQVATRSSRSFSVSTTVINYHLSVELRKARESIFYSLVDGQDILRTADSWQGYLNEIQSPKTNCRHDSGIVSMAAGAATGYRSADPSTTLQQQRRHRPIMPRSALSTYTSMAQFDHLRLSRAFCLAAWASFLRPASMLPAMWLINHASRTHALKYRSADGPHDRVHSQWS